MKAKPTITKRLYLPSASLLLLMTANAHAAIDCQGTVSYALLYANGAVNIRGSWRSDFTYLCNTNGGWGGIPAEVCLTWYATALKAAADNKLLTVYYETNTYTCANLPVYGASLAPYYVGLKQ